MPIYYHVSTQLTHSGHFEPRIPDNRHKEAEDISTPRICVAPTIEDCLTAIPNGGGLFDELCIYMRYYFLIFKIDTEKLGIDQSSIISSQELFEKDLVRDAEMTNECWITVPFTVPEEDRFVIRVLDWDEEPYDVIPYSIYKIADEQFEGDYLAAYEETYDEPVPCSVKIKNLKYITENVKKGDEVTLYFDFEDERLFILDYLKNHLPAKITNESMDEIDFIAEDDVNLKDLFLQHFKFIQY